MELHRTICRSTSRHFLGGLTLPATLLAHLKPLSVPSNPLHPLQTSSLSECGEEFPFGNVAPISHGIIGCTLRSVKAVEQESGNEADMAVSTAAPRVPFPMECTIIGDSELIPLPLRLVCADARQGWSQNGKGGGGVWIFLSRRDCFSPAHFPKIMLQVRGEQGEDGAMGGGGGGGGG